MLVLLFWEMIGKISNKKISFKINLKNLGKKKNDKKSFFFYFV